MFRASEDTIRQWIARYEAYHADGLSDKPRSGRPPKVWAAIQASVEKDVCTDPVEFGYHSAEKLCSHVWTRYDVESEPSTMYHLLRSPAFRHNRPRHAAKQGPDPQAKAKMDPITQVLSSAAAGNHVLCQDDHLLPAIRSIWMQCGKQIRIPTPGANQKRSVFGALDIHTGGLIHLTFDK